MIRENKIRYYVKLGVRNIWDKSQEHERTE